jgi:putative oxidoreductase
MKAVNCFIMLFGRIFLAIIFIFAGSEKFIHPHSNELYMSLKGFPLVPFFLYAAAITEILGGLFLLSGFQTRLAALVLFLFLIPTTLIFHDFWRASPAEAQMQVINFMKNISIMGGLLYVIANGPGSISLDHNCNRCNSKKNIP